MADYTEEQRGESQRIRKMLLDAIDDVKQTPVEQMKVQLIAAGWTPKTQHIWRDPNGKLHLGPYGAWKKMKAELLRLSKAESEMYGCDG